MSKLLLFLSFSLPAFLFAQTYSWAKGFGGALSDNGNTLVVDANAHVYHAGVFQDTVDFDPSSASLELVSSANGSAYIQRLSEAGDLVWAKALTGTGSSQGEAIAMSDSGYIYLTGNFRGTVDFDPGVGTFNLTAPLMEPNIYLLKLDSLGNFIWARQMESTALGAARDLAVDAVGAAYLIGNFEGITDFDPGIGTTNLTATPLRDGFVVKLDAGGDLVWVKQFENSLVVECKALSINGLGEVFVTGKFWGTTDFDPGTAVLSLTSAGADDAFIFKLTPAGDLAWVKQIGGLGYEYGYDVQLDLAGNIYLTGSFQETVDMDPGTGVANMTSAGGDDIYVLKLDASGDFIWGKRIGGTGFDLGISLQIDAGSNVYASGSFQETVDFDPGSGSLDLSSAGSNDVFILKLNAIGNLMWATQLGGASLDFCLSLGLHEASASLYTTGIFMDSVDFDPGPGVSTLHAVSISDIFVHKLSVSFTSSIGFTPTAAPLVIYPNPSDQWINLETDYAFESVQFYNQLGQSIKHLVQMQDRGTDHLKLDISLLKAGVYLWLRPVEGSLL